MLKVEPEAAAGGAQGDLSSTAQGELLLSTKLFVPPIRSKRVARPRLVEQISCGLAKPLILVSAPAGYGKTTLASSWLAEIEVASAWLSLDEGDNDPIRFLQNLIACLQRIFPAIHPDLLSALRGAGLAPPDALLNLLINELAGQPADFVLVLDDLHVLHAQLVLEMLSFLLEHLPPRMHLALLTRSDPPLPLSRLRARDQLLEIRAEQLRFTQEEAAAFLSQVMGLRLPVEDMLALEAHTEGWIAGLQLAALSLQGSQDAHAFVSGFTGSHRYIMDYLTEEVLKLQPEGLRAFLLQTSILTSMCAPLCEAVVGAAGAGPADGQAALETLERGNLFVVPLDEKRQWYRYHHLFADILNQRLEQQFPQRLPELHRRASLWYERNGILSEAIRHALLAGDPPRAAQLVEGNGCALLMAGEGFTLLQWVEAVESYSSTRPWLAVLRAWALALTGSLEQVEPALQTAGELVAGLDPGVFEVKVILGSLETARAYLANLQGKTRLAAGYARRSLEILPLDNDFSCSLRSVATSILGDASWIDGDLQAARQAYLEAARISRAANGSMTSSTYMTIIANANLADVLAEQGELHPAARLYSESLQLATRADGQKLPLADRLYAGLGKIAYEWNQLELAEQCARSCSELSRQWGNAYFEAKGAVLLARVEHARRNPGRAQEALREAENLAEAGRLSILQASSVKIDCALGWIALGSPDSAARLLQQMGAAEERFAQEAEIPPGREAEAVLVLRLLLAQGEATGALPLSARLLAAAQAARRAGRVIEILCLQALAYQGLRDLPGALEALGKALVLAQPQGYARVFLDEGEPMARLLYQAKARGVGAGYPGELLSAPGEAPEAQATPAQLLLEPLTRREVEVLRLIAAGCSNQEIAGQLVISMPTVKRHISNIYGKLGVRSRTQAVSQGRELGILS